jgi:hypothetical protein
MAKFCTNGHPLGDTDRFCGQCGAQPSVTSPVTACPNGHPITAADTFCGECGAALPQTPTTTQSPVTAVVVPPPMPPAPLAAPMGPNPAPLVAPQWSGGPDPSGPRPTGEYVASATRRQRWPWVVAAAVLVLAVGGIGAVLLLRKNDSGSAAGSATTILTSSTTSTTPATTATTVDGTRAALVSLDGILTRAATGRANLSTILTSVQPPACSMSPAVAYQQLQAVIDNRQSTLAAVQVLDAPGAVAQLKTTLISALEASLASDRSYQRAIGHLSSCAALSAADPSMAAAAGTDATASAAKAAFVAAYNPLAAQYGLPARSADQL